MSDSLLLALIVENDEIARTKMRGALEDARVQVVEAGTVAEGLARFHEIPPDIVVIDLHLPNGAGYSLASYLWRQQPHLPILMISADFCTTGYPPPRPRSDRRLALLGTPFSTNELLDAIGTAIANPVTVRAHG